jgi:hypothetical protein
VVETNIHYPTDSSLLGDGVRVLTRSMRRITKIAGAAGTELRDRSRSVKLKVLEIARAARSKGRWLDNYQKLKAAIEGICELNRELLRPAAASKRRTSPTRSRRTLTCRVRPPA